MGGTRELRLNTIIDNNFKGNIQVLSGGSYGLGELGKGASNIELNVGIYRTDSSAYKQEEFEAFKTEVAEKLSMQQDILMKIASELGLNKNKDGKQKG